MRGVSSALRAMAGRKPVLILALAGVVKVVAITPPLFSADGELVSSDVAVYDVAPVAVCLGFAGMLDLLAAWRADRDERVLCWIVLVVSLGGSVFFAALALVGDLLERIVSIGAVRDYQSAEVGIAVVVSMVACIASAVVAPIAAVTNRVVAGASSAPDVESWESSSAAPVYDAMSQLAPPPSVRLFGDE